MDRIRWELWNHIQPSSIWIAEANVRMALDIQSNIHNRRIAVGPNW